MSRFDKMLNDLTEENNFSYSGEQKKFLKALDDNQLGNIGGMFSKYKFNIRIVSYTNFIPAYGNLLVNYIIHNTSNYHCTALNDTEKNKLNKFVENFYDENIPVLVNHIKYYYSDYPEELPEDKEITKLFKEQVTEIQEQLKVNINKYNVNPNTYWHANKNSWIVKTIFAVLGFVIGKYWDNIVNPIWNYFFKSN